MKTLFYRVLIFFTVFTVSYFYYHHRPRSVGSGQSSAQSSPSSPSGQSGQAGQPSTMAQWFSSDTTTSSQQAWTAPVNPQYPSEWTTTDGQKFSKVKVLSMAPDAVTIMHSDGVSVVNLSVLPSDLQRTFNYNPSTARAGATSRQNDENSANAEIFREKVDSMISQINETSGLYMITQEEHEHLIPYKTNIDQLKDQLSGYISTLEASKQKMQSDLAALDHTDSQAVDRYNAEVKQYNDYRVWVSGQLDDFCTQALNYNNELKMHGTRKSSQ